MAYRTGAPPAVETLHTLVVRPSKGSSTVALLFAAAIIFAVALVITLIGGPPGGIEGVDRICALGTLVFFGIGIVLQRTRRRELRVERVGERERVVIEHEGVIELEAPIVCHGTQFTGHAGRVPMYEVYLQLVGANGRAIMLHETRGAIYGPEKQWFADDVDRSVQSALFDVGGAGTLAKVRSWFVAW